LENLPLFKNFLSKDKHGREINFYRISDVVPCGVSLVYPNLMFVSSGGDTVYKPIKEDTMSLKNVKIDSSIEYKLSNFTKEVLDPVFFFVYNTDNYYHFIYDTLPYLISFFEIKKEVKNLKLLMNYPNNFKNSFYKFVEEFLELLGIKKTEIIIVNKETKYKEVYISTSYTHDLNSNLPPRIEIYDFYKKISEKVKSTSDTPKKIYISRRSWLHGDVSNMGTNYTNRRKLENEDEIVEFLTSLGFVEVFTEKLSTYEKINLFKNCEEIVGPIGGGLCNVLFSKPDTKLIPIISPFFLKINERFLYSFSNIKTHAFYEVEHVEKTSFKKYMRVKCGNIVGEINEVLDNTLEVMFTDSPVAGWNSEGNYKKTIVNCSDCIKLDDGLNSTFKVDLDKFKQIFNNG
jgi:hypothetical protein